MFNGKTATRHPTLNRILNLRSQQTKQTFRITNKKKIRSFNDAHCTNQRIH
jgi:hypothetical protein